MLKNIFKKKQKNTTQVSSDTLAAAGEYTVFSQNSSKKKKIIIAITSISLAVVIAFCAFIFSLFYVKKDFAYVSSFTTLPDPVQIETSNQITKTIDDYSVIFDVKATYTITGMVVEKYYYAPFKFVNKLSKYDLGIIWGPLLGENLEDHMTFKNKGNRFLHYTYSYNLIQKLGKDNIVNSLSNNHMIHSDEHVLKLLRNVKEGDYIKVEGYLVNVSYSNNRMRGTWPTSLSRTDHGDGACEIIYVTNIIWLQEQ